MGSGTSRWILIALIAGLFVWVFADALFFGGVFAFRDAAHYYYPLLQFTADQWKSGQVPLWNPHENLGVPLAANATTGAFYPGTLVFLLPLDYAWAYNLYVTGHVLLAAWAAFRLARHWGGSPQAACVAATSYAFSGNVLFQHCNVVFLVGAAWLPWAVLAADRMLRRPSGIRGAVALGVVLALMTLGGNAEMAYHAGLMAATYALWLWWGGRTPGDEPPLSRRATGGWTSRRPVLLAVAAAVALILSAVQVVPSIELTRRSGRASATTPRSVYELAGRLLRADAQPGGPEGHWSDGLTCRRLDRGTHHEHAYQFSVGPWRLAEYLWPNFSGRQFPVHRRWLEVIPYEERVWVPSLYMGLVPLVLALAAVRLWGGTARRRWLSWTVLLSVLASFGSFGLGWLYYEVFAGGAEESPAVGAPFGGLYWLMTVLLPGYVYFRYPAKLLVIAAFGLSMLAAAGWDRALDRPSRGLRRWLLWLGGISLAGAAAALAVLAFRDRLLAGVGPDVLFGPLDRRGAAIDLVCAFLQTAAVCGLFWWLLGSASKGRRWAGVAALALVAVDLAVANRWMVGTAPRSQWSTPPKLAAVIEEDNARRGGDGPYRVFRHPIWMPPSFCAAPSPDRLAEHLRWDRHTLWPKHHLPPALAVAEVEGTMKPYDYQVFLWVAKRGRTRENNPPVPRPPGLDAINVKYLILRGEAKRAGLEPIPLDRVAAESPEDVSLWHNPDFLPRSWIVHEVDVLPPIESNDPYTVWRRTEEVLYPGGRPRDFRRSAAVEIDEEERRQAPFLQNQAPAPFSADEETCRVVHYEPSCVEIEADLDAPGLVVLSDQFYPGWRLEVETDGEAGRTVPILRTNRVMRGAWLPAGHHRLVYRFRPASFLWGAAVSGVGWLALAALGLLVVVSRRREG
ncbi:MAG: YfhO family protein [Planctomycetota bacterium]|jgi:hypothetical protein